MKVEIITTGDEIMGGVTLDTNFHWATEKLVGLGFDLRFHTTVGDDEEAITEALRTAMRRAQVVIVSGGLGPTSDDLTTAVASCFFGVPLELSNVALDMIENRFKERGYEFSEINKKQAYVPQGSKILKNFWGTAPGFQYEKEGTLFFFLPGVPKEFKAMIEEYVVPELDRRTTGRKKYTTRMIKAFGLRESEVADKIQSIERYGIRIGYRPHFPEVHIRVSGYGDNEDEADRVVSEVVEEITSRLGEYVFSTDEMMLEEVVGKLLSHKKLTLALAESCTGGLVAHRITNVPGSSSYFERGIVSYSNASKIEILGVPKELIESLGAVSAEVVEAMAWGVKRLAHSDIGVAISGIAGPGGGTEAKPVGMVFVGISHKKGLRSRKFHFKGTREEIKLISSEAALDWIRKFILNDV